MLKMKAIIFSILVTTMQMMTWVSATRMHFTPFVTADQQDRGHILQSPQASFVPEQELARMEKSKRKEEEYRGLSRLGSRPPNCFHKCRNCTPCIAIQVPTTADQLGLQYANYEPEGWKCKCGSSFFNP